MAATSLKRRLLPKSISAALLTVAKVPAAFLAASMFTRAVALRSEGARAQALSTTTVVKLNPGSIRAEMAESDGEISILAQVWFFKILLIVKYHNECI